MREGGAGGGRDLEMVTEWNFQEKAACRYLYIHLYAFLYVSECVCV